MATITERQEGSHEISTLIAAWLSENPRRSLKKLSLLTGVSKSYLGSILGGELPSLGILIRLSAVLPRATVFKIAIQHYPELREFLIYGIEILSRGEEVDFENVVRKKDEIFTPEISRLEDLRPNPLHSRVM